MNNPDKINKQRIYNMPQYAHYSSKTSVHSHKIYTINIFYCLVIRINSTAANANKRESITFGARKFDT